MVIIPKDLLNINTVVMDIVGLKNQLRTFVDERDWAESHNPENLTMALMVEVGELMEHFQWLTIEESNNISKEKKALVADEIADVFNYTIRLADVFGIDVLDTAIKKVKKNIKKYLIEEVKNT